MSDRSRSPRGVVGGSHGCRDVSERGQTGVVSWDCPVCRTRDYLQSPRSTLEGLRWLKWFASHPVAVAGRVTIPLFHQPPWWVTIAPRPLRQTRPDSLSPNLVVCVSCRRCRTRKSVGDVGTFEAPSRTPALDERHTERDPERPGLEVSSFKNVT